MAAGGEDCLLGGEGSDRTNPNPTGASSAPEGRGVGISMIGAVEYYVNIDDKRARDAIDNEDDGMTVPDDAPSLSPAHARSLANWRMALPRGAAGAAVPLGHRSALSALSASLSTPPDRPVPSGCAGSLKLRSPLARVGMPSSERASRFNDARAGGVARHNALGVVVLQRTSTLALSLHTNKLPTTPLHNMYCSQQSTCTSP